MNLLKNFADFGLEPRVLQAITELGFEEATPIQSQSIPIALTGKDMIGQAQTGTGKTAAFGLPLIHKIAKEEERIVALIMTPTRELAIQVAEEIGKLSRFKGIRSLAIYGGQDIGRQIRALKRSLRLLSAHQVVYLTTSTEKPSDLTMSKPLYWMKRMKCWTWASWKTSSRS